MWLHISLFQGYLVLLHCIIAIPLSFSINNTKSTTHYLIVQYNWITSSIQELLSTATYYSFYYASCIQLHMFSFLSQPSFLPWDIYKLVVNLAFYTFDILVDGRWVSLQWTQEYKNTVNTNLCMFRFPFQNMQPRKISHFASFLLPFHDGVPMSQTFGVRAETLSEGRQGCENHMQQSYRCVKRYWLERKKTC
jgi:hypothetical protein